MRGARGGAWGEERAASCGQRPRAAREEPQGHFPTLLEVLIHAHQRPFLDPYEVGWERTVGGPSAAAASPPAQVLSLLDPRLHQPPPLPGHQGISHLPLRALNAKGRRQQEPDRDQAAPFRARITHFRGEYLQFDGK